MLQTWLLKIGTHLLRKPRFRKWAEQEDIKYEVIRAAEQGASEFPELFHRYISAALMVRPSNFDTIFWKDEALAFFDIHRVSVVDTSLPIISRSVPGGTEGKEPWDYSGRLWYFYSHIIASAYGWTMRVIAGLKVIDALAYIQEILTDKQLRNEFLHGLSERSYTYDKMTKKSRRITLPRPYWMAKKSKTDEEIKIRIPKDLLPMGVIEKIHDKTKETKPS